MAKRRGWANRLFNTSLASLTSGLRQRAVAAIEPQVRQQVLRELAAKGYDEIGPAEIASGRTGILYDLETRENAHTLSSLYEIHLWVQTCVSMVATSLPLAPLRFYKAIGFKDGREELEPWDEHPLVQQFQWINPQMDPFAFWEFVVSFLQLVGEAYVAKVPVSSGAPEGVQWDLYPMFPAFVRKKITPREGILSYIYRVEGEEVEFDARDVMFFKTFSPSDRWQGQGILHAGKPTVLTDLRAMQFNDNLLKNGVFIHGTLETEDDAFDANDAETARDEFERRYAGSDNAARIAVLWGGLKFQPHQLAHSDIQFIEQRKMSREEIAVGHGIPLELLGLISANYATLREKRRIFWQDTVQRWGMRIEGQMNSTTLPIMTGDQDLRCAWDYSQIDALQADLFEVIKAGDIAIRSGQVTPDEWRTLQLRLPALDGASALQFIGGGLKPIERVATEAADAVVGDRGQRRIPSDSGEDDDALPSGEDEEQETQRRLRLQRRAPRLASATRSTMEYTTIKARQRSFMDLWTTSQERFEKRMHVMLRNVSREAQREIKQVLASRSLLGEGELVQEIERIFIIDGAKAAKTQAKEIMRLAAERWGNVTAADVGVADVFNLENTRAIKYIEGRGRFFDEHYKKQGRKIMDRLRMGIREGMGQKEIENELAVFFRGDRARAQVIARTETVGAMNFSSNEALELANKYGADVRSIWRTMADGHVRDGSTGEGYDHASAEGLEIIPGDEVFVVSGESLRFPCDTSLGATLGNIVNCRCVVQPRVVEKRK